MNVPGTPARHLPTPVQRWTAAVKSPPSWVNAKPPSAGMGCAATRRRFASRGSTPGWSSSAPSAGAPLASLAPLAPPDAADRGALRRARPPSAPSPGWGSSAPSAGAQLASLAPLAPSAGKRSERLVRASSRSLTTVSGPPCAASPPAPPLRAARARARAREAASASSMGAASTPGLRRLPGSKTCLTRANRSSISGEYMKRRSSPRARPSPCSPETEPPWAAQMRAADCRNARECATPAGVSSGMARRTCTQPSPKCPYRSPSMSNSSMRAVKSRRYAPRFSGGTAASSKPGQACWSPPPAPSGGVRPPRPAPSARILHRAEAWAPGGYTTVSTAAEAAHRARARSREAVTSSPGAPTSTRSQPSPSGRAGTAPGPLWARTTSTRRRSMPSTARGEWASSAGTSSAASIMER